MRFATALLLIMVSTTGLMTGRVQAQMTHAQNQQMQQRHAREMNLQGWLNEQRQRQGAQQQQPQPSRPDPMEGMVNSLRTLVDLQQKSLMGAAEGLNALANDPRYRRLKEGYWTQYQEGDPLIAGEGCAATFMSMDGMLGITALGGYKDPALLLLSGLDVPNPQEVGVVRATLHQTGERAQTVPVHNFAMPGGDAGTLAFAVPSLEAAVQGLANEAVIAVDVDGKRIYSVTYHSGHQAGAGLEHCAKAAG